MTPLERSNAIRKASGLEAIEKLALFVLASHADPTGARAYPSHKTLGRECGFDRRTAARAVKGLVDKGLVTSTARYSDSGDPTSNEYRIVDAELAKLRGTDPEPRPEVAAYDPHPRAYDPHPQGIPPTGVWAEDLEGVGPRSYKGDPLKGTPSKGTHSMNNKPSSPSASSGGGLGGDEESTASPALRDQDKLAAHYCKTYEATVGKAPKKAVLAETAKAAADLMARDSLKTNMARVDEAARRGAKYFPKLTTIADRPRAYDPTPAKPNGARIVQTGPDEELERWLPKAGAAE